MRRINPSQTREDVIAYNLRDDGQAVTVFDIYQPDRVAKARAYVARLLDELDLGRPAVIRELCCGAADISGPFSEEHEVHGYDIVPAAAATATERFPKLHMQLVPIENVTPVESDVLILCETLEHLIDPVRLVIEWLPLARGVVIGHPLNEPEPFLEPGHVWRYDRQDYVDWFAMGGHELIEAVTFEMLPFPEMVLGFGKRRGSA